MWRSTSWLVHAAPRDRLQRKGVDVQRKFKIGQKVTFSPGKLTMSSTTRDYSITRVLPHESGEFTYRIKSVVEQFERVAKESEMTAKP